MNVWRDVEQCSSRMVRDLHAVWDAKRGSRALPRRADFDPVEIKHLLANMLIVDIEPSPFRVRYRLVGTKVVAASGYDFTGRYLDEIELASDAGQWQSHYAAVYAEARPLFGTADLPTADGGRFTYAFAILPVTTGGDALDQCLEIEDYGVFNDRLFELQEKVERWRPQPISARRGPKDR